jgi:predicted MFS family arabinose efflux permease
MGPMLGWRGTFVALGLVGVVVAVVMLFVTDPPRGGGEPLSAEVQPIGSFRESARGLAHALRTSPVLVMTLIASACTTFVQGGTVLDIVWWVQERGFTEARAQQVTGAIFLVGGISGALLGGFGADWAYRRWGAAGRLWFIATAYAIVAPALLAYRLIPPDTLVFYGCAFVGSMSMMMFYGAAFPTVQEVVPVNLRGAAVALLILFNTLIGHAAGGALTGYLADAFTTSGMKEPLTWALLLAGLPGLFAIPAYALAARRLRPK